VAFRRFPRLFPPKHRLLLNTLIPLAVRRAAGVLTGSESTRSDLIELFGADPDRVAVTPYAADPMFTPMPRTAAQDWVRSRLGVPAPYVLAVGVLQPRKNLPRLLRAYAALGSEFPHRLVIVGKQGWDDTELRTAASGLGEARAPVFTGYVEDADLRPLYAGADVFAYPSLYEGFGLPPLEAMACGTPVITGNTSSLPEVVGDAAITVNPYDESEIAMALRRMLGDDALRSRLACLGLAQAASFSWARTAAETVRAYERFVGSARTG
jgi:glycosyltransferase involved in cell wall biosynthesis